MADDDRALDYSSLTRAHPERAFWFHKWQDYRLLYRGGEEFLAAAGQAANVRADYSGATSTYYSQSPYRLGSRRRRFLYQLEGEPEVKYVNRWDRAVYLNYYGAIIDYFALWLFSQAPVIRSDGAEEPPDWYKALDANADGKGTRLFDFVRDGFRDALIMKRAGWVIASPDMAASGMSVADAEAVGLAGVRLTPYAADEIYDWDVDEAGALRWIVVCKKSSRRDFPGDRVQFETFTYLDREGWAVYEALQGGDEQHKDVRLLAAGQHGIGKVPFVWFDIAPGLWVGNKIAAWAVDLFNKYSMLSYGQLMSCFLQPAIVSNDLEGADSRILGEGILLKLRAGRGDEKPEDFKWISPSSEPLRFNAEQLAVQRDEGYRIVHQMSLAVDPQNVSRQGQSGVSKSEDRLPTEVILSGYGAYARAAIKQTLDLISEVQGDGARWTVDGFDSFNVRTLQEELETAALISTLPVQSPTATATIAKSILTGRAVGKIDEVTKQTIAQEIDEQIEAQREAAGGVISVNEARARLGLAPLTLADGSPDPDGELTVGEFTAKQEAAAGARQPFGGGPAQRGAAGEDGDEEEPEGEPRKAKARQDAA